MKNISTKLTITTREFLENYLGVKCTVDKHVSHKDMQRMLEEKHQSIPKGVKIDALNIEEVLIGNYLLVRAESSKKKKSQIIAYKNPFYESPEKLLRTTVSQEELTNRRKSILAESNLEYDVWERVVELTTDSTQRYESYNITEKTTRQAAYQKSFHKGRKL